jgi:acetyl-CoA/propionyl-CoA carboxylase biotin carboxyl carrier protein
MTLPFASVLIANRGEITVRVARTLRRLGVGSIAVFTDADADALHVTAADHAVRIGSYLSVDDVVGAALSSGADAIHPGYGFLSENPALARACAEAGVVFVGPPAAAIEAMGDKIAAKATVAAAGVSVVPGSDGAGLTDDQLAAAAVEVGFPVLLKPSAGGGGKGMRLVERVDDLASAIASARREAAGSFGDDTLLLERFITDPRHIEIQVLADSHGGAVHLGERECSLQRRHQKIIEEAPSPLLTDEVRDRMGHQAVDAAHACGYVGAGTVEFIVSGERPDEFFFMEMNTRLQVEHPVTEMVYGVDLVEEQLRVAAGEPLRFAQADLMATGHAIEARLYAEDPSRGFLPTGGTIERFVQPTGDGVRVDAGIADRSHVGSDFDPMLAKIIAWGVDRDAAIGRLYAALAETAVLGVTTNVGFLRRLLDVDAVRDGALDTGLVERHLDDIADPPSAERAATVAALMPLVESLTAPDPWSALVGWRHGAESSSRIELDVRGSGRLAVEANGPVGVPTDAGRWRVRVDDGERVEVVFERAGDSSIETWDLVAGGDVTHASVHRRGATTWVAIEGDVWAVERVVHRAGEGDAGGAAGDGVVRSPMPGTIIDVSVDAGDEVSEGQVVAVVEAMKMEHSLTAPIAGVVETVHAPSGASVALDAPVVTIIP